jgi:hypothetical protein
MTASIPASAIVNVNPSVLEAGGTGLDLNGLFLTRTERVPMGTAIAFASSAAVEAYFGPSSAEAVLAARYFAGFDGSQIKPAQILFATYPTAAVPAYLRGGSLAGMTLTQLQALSGVLTLTVNGRSVTSSAINFSAAASFAAAAALMQTGLNDADAVVTGSIAATTLTVTAVASGTLRVGQIIEGTGITAGTRITALGTGTGGTGTYTVTPSQTASSTSITAGRTRVTHDAIANAFVITAGTPETGSITFAAGTLAAGVKLREADGAVISAAAALLAPAGLMAALTAFTQNFASFATAYVATTDDSVAFATWADGANNRYLYIMGDTNLAATIANDVSSAGAIIKAGGLSGTLAVFDPVNPAAVAAFVAGAIAAVDFSQAEGRTTLAFRRQASLPAGVTDRAVADNLIANGYNFYGSYATAADEFVFFYPGQVSGPYLWADSFINQIWLTNNFQLALVSLLLNVRSIPYNDAGYSLIGQAIAGPVNEALSFGAIRTGVPLSPSQTVAVNTEAGIPIADTIEERGWYLLIKPASAEVRAARGSPPMTFWYTDGQSVQKISLNSVQVQ